MGDAAVFDPPWCPQLTAAAKERAVRARLKQCNSTLCTDRAALPTDVLADAFSSSSYASSASSAVASASASASSAYRLSLIEAWDLLGDALFARAMAQGRSFSLAQYSVGVLMASYAIKLLLVPALFVPPLALPALVLVGLAAMTASLNRPKRDPRVER